MTAIVPSSHKSSARHQQSPKIDMTPMVDLGFLLITFFIFTAALSQPRITRLIMPKEGEPSPVPEKNALTLLLHKEKVVVYKGRWEDAVQRNAMVETTYDLLSGFGGQIRKKQKSMPGKDDLTVVIKPLESASYQQVIAALDEMQINDVKKFALADASDSEAAYAHRH